MPLKGALLLASLLACAAPLRAADKDDASLTDPDLRQAVDQAEGSNLENAAEASKADAAGTLRWIRSLLLSSEADAESGRVELENLLRDPVELRRRLGAAAEPSKALGERQEALLISLQMIAAKREDFLVKISSISMAVPREEAARLLSARDHYSAVNRRSDLRRASLDAEQAKKRLGVEGPLPESLPALEALDGARSEIREALAELKGAAKTLASPAGPDARKGPSHLLAVQESLASHIRSLENDIADLAREAELFRDYLMLQNAQRVITTGRK